MSPIDSHSGTKVHYPLLIFLISNRYSLNKKYVEHPRETNPAGIMSKNTVPAIGAIGGGYSPA